jgi:FkbM family methyltransferase
MSAIGKIAVGGPWRTVVEQLAVRLGHQLSSNRAIHSFCKHIGFHLVNQERGGYERIVSLSSGGKVLFRLGANTIIYFHGTMIWSPSEIPVERLLRRALQKGHVFFDIGANIGFYTFFAAPLVAESGSVHAFEPNPELVPNLFRSVELNKFPNRIMINAVAVGKVNGGKIPLYLPSDTRVQTNSGTPSTYIHDWLDPELKVSVPQVSIDEYMREKKVTRLDIVKVDTEGGELNVFKGMHNTLQRTPPLVIVCELMSKTASFIEHENLHACPSAPSPVDIVDFLHERGYWPWHIKKQDGRLDRRIERDEIVSQTQLTINVAFVRQDLQQIRPELFAGD